MATTVSFGSVIFDRFTDVKGHEWAVRMSDIKSPLSTPVQESLRDKKNTSTAALLNKGGTPEKVTTMSDWVLALLESMTDYQVTVSAEGFNRLVSLSSSVVRSTKKSIRDNLGSKKKLNNKHLDEIYRATHDALQVWSSEDYKGGLTLPPNLIKDSEKDKDMDDEVADYLGHVLASYLEGYIIEPTLQRTINDTAEGKKPVVGVKEVEETIKILNSV